MSDQVGKRSRHPRGPQIVHTRVERSLALSKSGEQLHNEEGHAI